MRDLERVRAALGVPRLDVYGASYGTRVALHYLHRHPERVRTLVLDGVTPVDWVPGPSIAADAQRSLDAVFARCRATPACREAYGDPAATFGRLLERLAAAPRTVPLRHPVSGEAVRLELRRAHLVLAVRMLSYQPETAALLPLLIDRAAAGDLAPLAAQVLIVADALGEAIAVGMHNSVICSEDLPFVDGPVETAGSYVGGTQFRALEALCEVWPRGVVDADLHEPFASDVPALVLSGSDDPVTPPANGAAAARHLSRSLELVGEGQGHGLVMRGCLPRLLAEFVASADPAGLDSSCVDELAPRETFTSFAGAPP